MGLVGVGAIVDRRWLKRADLSVLLFTGLALGLGLLALRSIGLGGEPQYLRKQLAWIVVGCACLVGGALVDCERIGKHARSLYVTNIVLLTAVLVAGRETKGAVRWFGTDTVRFQPSELAKLLVILTLSTLFARGAEQVRQPGTFLRAALHIVVPVALVLKQPDLGTALVIVAIWLGVSFIAGMPLRYHAVFLALGLALFGAAWKLDLIHDYQVRRLIVCFNPSVDPQGAGYQVKQARIAVGSGQVLGKGLAHGTQSHGSFIPERQTDFVFTVLAEEGGFVLSVVVVGVYVGLLLRGWSIVARAGGSTSRLVGAGILAMLGFHMMVNLGMTLGLMPVTGVPLPFVSYGGSSMIVSMTSIGLLLGISARSDPLVF